MAYADVKARLVTHAVTAGAALTPPITDVKAAFPLPKGRSVRVYYGGEAEPQRMGGRYTLGSELIARVTMIAAFWPITTLDETLAALIDAQADAFTHALRTAVDGDAALNGTSDNTTLDLGEPDLIVSGNTRYLMILWRAITDYTEYAVVKS